MSCLLYLQGVLPGLTDFLKLEASPLQKFPPGTVQIRAPGGLSGEWPCVESRGGEKPFRPAIQLHLLRYADGTLLFEKGYGWVLPGWGFWRLGLLWKFKRVADAFKEAISETEQVPELFQIQLEMLLRSACLLYNHSSAVRERVGNCPSGRVAIRLKMEAGESPMRCWIGLSGEGILTWGRGDSPGEVNGSLEVRSRKVIEQLFTGKLIGEEAVGKGTVAMRGNIPLIQGLNTVFENLELYIKPW